MVFSGNTVKLRGALAAIALTAVAGLVSGCGKNGEANTDGSLRVINVAPESGALTLKIDDNATNLHSGIAYKSTTGFGTVGNGTRRVRVSNAGGVILDTSIAMQGQKKQMLVVFGGASSTGMSIIYNDIAASAQGKSKLRLVSFAVGLGAYDLYMTTSTEDYRTVEPKVRNVAGTTFEVDTGSYTIRLTSPNTKDVLFEMPAKTFEDRKYYNLVLFNEGSGEVPNAFWNVQDDDAAPEQLASTVTRVRAINAQSTAATVNVAVGGTRVFTNIPFGGISSFTRTAAGARSVAFTDPTSGATLSSVTDTFVGGRDYSVFLSPSTTTGGAPSAFRVLDTYFPPASGKSRVRLVNASTSPDLALALSFTPISPSIATQAASAYFEVNAGTGTPVTITQGTAGTPVLTLSGTDLVSGKTHTFVVSGVPGALNLAVRQDN